MSNLNVMSFLVFEIVRKNFWVVVLENFSILISEKKLYVKIEVKNFENSFFIRKCIQIANSVPNLLLVSFQLSTDMNIVYIL